MDFGEAKHLSELRIVLLGNRAAGKSSAGNTILGRKEFDLKRSAQCVRRHGEVADRHITVIEAPGWWMNYAMEFSPELLKQEIVFSVSLCPPGPHVVLLIIRVDGRFREIERKAIEAHMALLGERVWSHTIVLFTHGDSLSDSSIERHIESEGQDLQWLLDKCGNRYHVLNNQDRSDDTQIKELLEKIEEMVAQNNGGHFEVDRNILLEMKQKSVKLAKLKSQVRSEDGDRRCSSARGVCDIRSQLIMESRRNHSLELPPSMSSHESSGRWSQKSSAESSFSPQIKAENEFGSSCSMASTVSSGYGSLLGLCEFEENSEHKRKNNMSQSSELCQERD